MKKKNIGIQEFLIRNTVLIAFISFGLLLSIWVINAYFVFSSESEVLRETYQNTQKAMLRNEVNNVVDYVEYMKAQTERKLKSELQERVYEAIDIATNIYQENAASKSSDEIKKMVKDALRPIRFLHGRGYYFAFSMDGVETLFPDRPEMEGVNMLPVQGARGEYVVKDMIDIVKKHQEGFYQYTWTKPSYAKKGFPKNAFVKYFEPFDWAIGTGEYLDDFTNQIQDMVLERIYSLRFREGGYFFGSMRKGYPLFTNGKITRGTDRIWDMTDPDVVKIIQEQQRVSKNPGGGFVQYRWQKPGFSDPLPKISFVREIPEWGWTIGAGVHLDDIERTIAKNKDTLKRELVKKVIITICVFIGLLILIWFWAKHVGSKTRKSIKTFEVSFKKAATDSCVIPTDDMQFRELSRIAESANKMIDSQKQSEGKLEESKLFLDNMTDIAYRADNRGNLVWMNSAGERVTGLARNDLIGKPFLPLLLETDHASVIDAYKRTLTGESLEDTLTFTSGVTCHFTSLPYRNDNGDIVGTFGVARDITARLEAQRSLAISEARLKKAQETAKIGNWDYDVSTGRVWGSEEAFRIYGIERTSEYLPLEEVESHIVEARRVNQALVDLMTRGKDYDIEFRITQKNGKGFTTIHSIAELVKDEEGNPVKVIGVIQDITEKKAKEEEYLKLLDQLQQAQKMESIGNLAGGIAHDFNNLLFPIVGMSEMLLEDLPPGSPEHQSVQEIFKAGMRGSDLVKQILAFSRQTEHQMMPVSVQQVLREVIKLTRSAIPSHIKVDHYLQGDCGLVVADPTQLHQIAMNLITNAFHAVEHTGGKISITLKETVLENDDLPDSSLPPGTYAMISVADNGCGIDPTVMGKIFEPYFTTKEQGKGTGLGLAVAYGIIKEHGGEIRVHSEAGKGTTFNIYLPMAGKQVEQAPGKTVESHQTGSERILLVDDEEAIVLLEKLMLERLGYRVTTRLHSMEALEAFKANPDAYDLIITDMIMPNMTGDQLARKLIAVRPDIPIIICTGFSDRANEDMAKATGARGFLMKPVVKSEMAQMVRKVLNKAEDTGQQ